MSAGGVPMGEAKGSVTRGLYVRGTRRNPTTRTGKIVHAHAPGGYPLCGHYIHGIVYTAEQPNCSYCAKVDPA